MLRTASFCTKLVVGARSYIACCSSILQPCIQHLLRRKIEPFMGNRLQLRTLPVSFPSVSPPGATRMRLPHPLLPGRSRPLERASGVRQHQAPSPASPAGDSATKTFSSSSPRGVNARWSKRANGCRTSVGISAGLIQGVRSSRKPCNACWCAFDGGAAQGTLEQCGDKLQDERVVGCGHLCHRESSYVSDGLLQRL
jgi:hypothetical protein